jgi:hypothetical protein
MVIFGLFTTKVVKKCEIMEIWGSSNGCREITIKVVDTTQVVGLFSDFLEAFAQSLLGNAQDFRGGGLVSAGLLHGSFHQDIGGLF